MQQNTDREINELEALEKKFTQSKKEHKDQISVLEKEKQGLESKLEATESSIS
jgi:hypothetical protein